MFFQIECYFWVLLRCIVWLWLWLYSRLSCCSCIFCCSFCDVLWTFSIEFLCWCCRTLLRFLSGFLNWFCFEMVSITIVWLSISPSMVALAVKSRHFFPTLRYLCYRFISSYWMLYWHFSEFCSSFSSTKVDISHIRNF